METIIAEILKYGLAGVFIAYLLYKNMQMEKKIDELQKTMLNYSQQVAKDNLDEHKNTLQALNNFNSTLTEIKQMTYEIVRKSNH